MKPSLLDAAKAALDALNDFNEQSKNGIPLPAEIDTAMDKLREFIAAAEKVDPAAPERGTVQVGDTLYHTLGGYLIGEVTAHPADVVRDAERYRWLRSSRSISDGTPFIARRYAYAFSHWVEEPADAAIDEAMTRSRDPV